MLLTGGWKVRNAGGSSELDSWVVAAPAHPECVSELTPAQHSTPRRRPPLPAHIRRPTLCSPQPLIAVNGGATLTLRALQPNHRRPETFTLLWLKFSSLCDPDCRALRHLALPDPCPVLPVPVLPHPTGSCCAHAVPHHCVSSLSSSRWEQFVVSEPAFPFPCTAFFVNITCSCANQSSLEWKFSPQMAGWGRGRIAPTHLNCFFPSSCCRLKQ